MGGLSAIDMRTWASSQDAALEWHLRSNHYPPVSLDFMPVVKKAIWHGNRQHWNKELELLNGKMLTVGKIIEDLHLDAFLGRKVPK